MKTIYSTPIRLLFAIIVLASLLIAVVPRIHRSGPEENLDPRYRQFMQWIAEGRTKAAIELGTSVFDALLQEKSDDSAVLVLAKKLEAARQINTLVVIDRVQLPRTALIEGMTGGGDLELPTPAAQSKDPVDRLLPPAREVYWTHLGVFTAEAASGHLTTQQAAFCTSYYDLFMRELILDIGRHVVATDPDFSEHVCYAMVLPLLYLHKGNDAWDQMEPLLTLFSPEMLDILSMFALLQIERPEAAMALARYRAKVMGKELSREPWASNAVDACIANRRPDLAEKALCLVVAGVKDCDAAAELRMMIADAYARCSDYAAAAQTCEGILADLPETSLYGRILATYLAYLAREGEAERVITMTKSALEDPRCRPYLTQILYLHWWALRKADRLEEATRIAQRLLEQDPRNPCVAPVLLERATDALVHQDYDRCRELLLRLTADFGGTESAKRAQNILTRLQDDAVDGMKE